MNAITRFLFYKDIRIRAVISSLYLLAGILGNFLVLQVYCMPVWWAAICFILSSSACIAFPFFKNAIVIQVASFFLGVGVFVFAYCHLFLWGFIHPDGSFFTGQLLALLVYSAGVFVYGGGLLAFIPLYFLFLIFRYYWSGHACKRSFWLGVLALFLALSIYLVGFRHSFREFRSAYIAGAHPRLKMERLKANHYTERLLGIGLKYHTRPEFMIDGWRPPLHDPFLNIGLWLYSDTHYPYWQLDREHYYKLMFPDKPLKVWCPCSWSHDGRSYFTQPWIPAY